MAGRMLAMFVREDSEERCGSSERVRESQTMAEMSSGFEAEFAIKAVTPQTQEIIESMGRYRKIGEGLT